MVAMYSRINSLGYMSEYVNTHIIISTSTINKHKHRHHRYARTHANNQLTSTDLISQSQRLIGRRRQRDTSTNVTCECVALRRETLSELDGLLAPWSQCDIGAVIECHTQAHTRFNEQGPYE